MIVRMGLLQKRADLRTGAFRQHWAAQHSGIAAQLPGLRAYRQNHVIEAAQRAITFDRGGKEYDGFSQLWFDNPSAMAQAIEARATDLATDERAFLGDLDLVLAESTTVIPEPSHEGATKRMSTLRRRPDISEEQFHAEWHVHADLVRRMPGVAGYVQNAVIGRAKGAEAKSGVLSGSYDDVPIDGIVEMWFDDREHIETAFSSPQGQRTMEHARTFLSTISTYLVEPIQVL